MKIVWWVIGGLILIGMVWLMVRSFGQPRKITTYTADDPTAPKLEMTEKKFDFGKISFKDVARHEFKLKNTGQNPLIITDIITSCHCATAVFKMTGQADSLEFGMQADASWQAEIPAGGEAVIESIYSPAKMPVSGIVSRVITFTSNDPAHLETQLEVIADVQQ